MNYEEKVFRAYCRGWEEGEVAGILAGLSDDVVIQECYGPRYKGKRSVERWARRWLGENGHVRWRIDEVLTDDRMLMARWRFSFRKPDGKRRSFNGMSFVRFSRGKITEIQEYWQTGEG